MADLNKLIESAKKKAVNQTVPDKDTAPVNNPSRTVFKQNGAFEVPQEADTAADKTPDTANGTNLSVASDNRLNKKEDSTAAIVNARKKNPQNDKKSEFLQNITDKDIDELLKLVENRKHNRKLRKETVYPPQINELKEKCRSFMDKRQVDDWSHCKIDTTTRNIMSLFSKVYGIHSQQLASYIIQSYLEENFTDFVKKARNMGL